MLKKYMPQLVSILFYAVAALGVDLVLVFLYKAISGLSSGSSVFEAHSYFRTLSDVLFIEGGLVLAIGAFLEFFAKDFSRSIARNVLVPYDILSKRLALRGIAVEGECSGGWTLIFTGAFIIALSAIFAVIFAK